LNEMWQIKILEARLSLVIRFVLQGAFRKFCKLTCRSDNNVMQQPDSFHRFTTFCLPLYDITNYNESTHPEQQVKTIFFKLTLAY